MKALPKVKTIHENGLHFLGMESNGFKLSKQKSKNLNTQMSFLLITIINLTNLQTETTPQQDLKSIHFNFLLSIIETKRKTRYKLKS